LVARFSFLYFRPSSSLICSESSGVLGICGCSVERIQDSHAFLLEVVYCPYWQMRIMVV
jgi:hypothetical protein